MTIEKASGLRITHITNTLALVLLASVSYGFVTDYLGYELSRKAEAQPEPTDSSSYWGKGVTTEDYPTPDIPYGAVEHRVSRIVDGDTVYLKDGTKVRLHGIDTPERDQPYGKQATRALDGLIGRTVFVVEKDTDRYGRLVGVIYTPEAVNVNLQMVCGGHAWWYSRYAKNNRAMADCQDEAKEAGLGLSAGDDPVAPWEWRRK